jgi:hypothetical protein
MVFVDILIDLGFVPFGWAAGRRCNLRRLGGFADMVEEFPHGFRLGDKSEYVQDATAVGSIINLFHILGLHPYSVGMIVRKQRYLYILILTQVYPNKILELP